MGPVDMLLQYTDEKAHWTNCPLGEIWDAIWNSLQIAFSLMGSEDRRRQCFSGSLIRLLSPEQCLSARLDTIAPHYHSDKFAWVSAGATLHLVG